jgi:hypothetical protein
MTQAQGRVSAQVLFVKPESTLPYEWEKTDLWASAQAIPGVSVREDNEGLETKRFRAASSGQTALYSKDGKLLFSGGITSARGHEGDNAGRSAIVALLTDRETITAQTPVFGCALFSGSEECPSGLEHQHQ